MTRVVRALAPNPGPFTLEGTNTWIVGERPSLVIDPGPDDSGHLLAVADEAEPVEAILLTHRHPDHAPGAPRLAEATRAPIYSSRPQGNERAIRHGQVLEVGSMRIRAVNTPGHSPDHLAFYLERDGFLFTGDAVLGRGTSIVDPPDGDMTAYMRSLQEMRLLSPRVIYPGHGPVVFDAIPRLDGYLEHRVHRERQVIRALREGKASAQDMVAEIYADEVPESMFPAAARSVLAHLLKLEREGRVARIGRPVDARFELVTPKPCARCGRPAAPRSRFCNRCAITVLQEGPQGKPK